MTAARLASLALLALLAACGFQPLYGQGPRQADPGQLGNIEVAPIADRLGQITRNHLLDRLNPRGRPLAPEYRLEVILSESNERLAFRKDATATRALMRLVAHYRLTEIASGTLVHGGASRATASYNIVASDFATIASEKNARERVSRIVAEDVALRLSVCFSRRETCFKPLPPPPPAPAPALPPALAPALAQ
jgi:LPS-assembly lipoprotein